MHKVIVQFVRWPWAFQVFGFPRWIELRFYIPFGRGASGAAICKFAGAHPPRTKTESMDSTRRNTVIIRRAGVDSPVPFTMH